MMRMLGKKAAAPAVDPREATPSTKFPAMLGATEKYFSSAQAPEELSATQHDVPTNPGKFCVTLSSVLTSKECKMLVSLAEERGFSPALINVGGGRQQLMQDVRNNERAIIDSPIIAEALWQRIKHVVPQKMGSLHAVGLNERLRILRYDPGTRFAPHFDGSYVRAGEAGEARRGERSKITLLLYVNEECEGGHTNFLKSNDEIVLTVVPKPGLVLMFDHNMLHEGAAITKGRKYTIRTDVMFTAEGPGHEYSVEPVVLQK